MKNRLAPRVLIAIAALVLLQRAPAPAAGNPFDQTVTPLNVGDELPHTQFLDQTGRRVSFSQFLGTTTVIAFIFTHCKDECPLITQRFAQLDRLLGEGPYSLVEVSIDPTRDTVPVVAQYAKKYGIGGRWRVLTGEPKAVNAFVRAAGVSVIANGTGDLIHNTELFIVDPHGRIAKIVGLIAWNPSDIAAVAEHVAGASSSLFGRVDFAVTDAIAGLCGGSYQTASGLVDIIAALILISAGVLGLVWLRRRVFAQGG